MDPLIILWAKLHAAVFESVVQPIVFNLGMVSWLESSFEATELFLLGAVQVILIALVLSALERWRPVEIWTDRRAIGVDIIYTLLMRLGILPLAIFFLLLPLVGGLDGWLRLHDFIPPKLEDAFPSLFGHPFVSFVAYLVIIDFVLYWLHRGQHQIGIWWALHSLHHSQREMTFWTDDRNHLLDTALIQGALALSALVIGVAPGQFVAIIAVTRIIESFSHANVRLAYGRIGELFLVSPRYHRVHHAIGFGHEGARMGANFAILFPVWDHIFGTASAVRDYTATGIRDQLHGRNYGQGFWQQQWLGFKRMTGRA
ncbi:MAG TPA: sterol desaturase family protein [Usitatibacteraceae bacterium]|nr:sterol desaturase family protein [Usitatibacteraceae bacterium]